MRTEPCKQCGSIDYYIRGEFSYCRPCHNETQKKYLSRKRIGEELSPTLKPPHVSLADMVLNSLPDTCKHGHRFSGDNVRMSSQRNGRHLRRRCRACERNAKRVKYGLAPEAPTKLSDLLDS